MSRARALHRRGGALHRIVLQHPARTGRVATTPAPRRRCTTPPAPCPSARFVHPPVVLEAPQLDGLWPAFPGNSNDGWTSRSQRRDLPQLGLAHRGRHRYRGELPAANGRPGDGARDRRRGEGSSSTDYEDSAGPPPNAAAGFSLYHFNTLASRGRADTNPEVPADRLSRLGLDSFRWCRCARTPGCSDTSGQSSRRRSSRLVPATRGVITRSTTRCAWPAPVYAAPVARSSRAADRARRRGDACPGDPACTTPPAVVRNRVRCKSGADLLTPLRLDAGTAAWTAAGSRGTVEAGIAEAAPPTGTVNPNGASRGSARSPRATPLNQPSGRRASLVDLDRIASKCTRSWIEAQVETAAGPRPSRRRRTRSNHSQYVIQWWLLVLVPLVGWPILLVRLRKRNRLDAAGRQQARSVHGLVTRRTWPSQDAVECTSCAASASERDGGRTLEMGEPRAAVDDVGVADLGVRSDNGRVL